MDTGDPDVEKLAAKIVDAAFKVHSALGPGLLECVYEQCLSYELSQRGLRFELQKPVPVTYGTVQIDCALRLDVLVEEKIIIEIKAIETVLPVHKAQLLSYLCLANKPLGLLINFHVPLIKDGIKRIIHKAPPTFAPSRLRV